MEEQPQHGPVVRLMRRRVRRKGFTPRVAASLIAFLWAVGVVVFGVLEHLVDPDSFDSIWLGMWWALQTVTTVGYGDVTPESVIGRAIATIVMLTGIGFLTVVTASITAVFVESARRKFYADTERAEQSRHSEILERLERIESQLPDN
jgi:hypothetical protein